MRRAKIIGMNSPTGEALLPTGENSAADRLLKMSGLTREEFFRSFWRINVLDGREWEPIAARRSGEALLKNLRGDVIVLGRQTWEALGLPRIEFFERAFVISGETTTALTLVPHPSGRCRTYNDPAAREKLRLLMRILSTPSRSPTSGSGTSSARGTGIRRRG